MFRSILCAAAFSVASFQSLAVETLDVLVVYDNNTISGVSSLNTSAERLNYARKLVYNINKTISNSGLSSHINFRLDHQMTTGFSNTISGNIENLNQIVNRYHGYATTNAQTGNASGWLYTLQNAYQADVVIGVFEQGPAEKLFCGMATNIPSVSMKGGDTSNQLQEFAGFGLFFIDTRTNCLTDEQLVSHEFGHTAGLFHEPTEVDSNGNTINNVPKMLVSGAAGYRDTSLGAIFSTVMVQADRKLFVKENSFSDKYKDSCGQWNSYTCGNYSSNAVATLKAFAPQYNKRGRWYYNNGFFI